MSEKDERGGREAFGYFRNTAILNPDWHDRNYYHQQVEYVRADLSDALLREAMEALGKLHHAVCCETGFVHCVRLDSGLAYPWPALDDADEIARATLAKLRAHLEEPE